MAVVGNVIVSNAFEFNDNNVDDDDNDNNGDAGDNDGNDNGGSKGGSDDGSSGGVVDNDNKDNGNDDEHRNDDLDDNFQQRQPSFPDTPAHNQLVNVVSHVGRYKYMYIH